MGPTSSTERERERERDADMLSKLFEPLMARAARSYQAMVGYELKKYGLRYDDLYDQLYSTDINEALDRLPQDVQDARNQRLKRAMDLSCKHVYLSKEMQEKQTPFQYYLQDSLKQVEDERKEKAELDTPTPYSRQIP